MEVLFAILWICIIVLILMAVWYVINKIIKKLKQEKINKELKETIESLVETKKGNNIEFFELLKLVDINTEKKYVLSDDYTVGLGDEYKNTIVIDQKKKKIVFFELYNDSIMDCVCSFKEILSYEIVENFGKKTIGTQTGSGCGMISGGMVLGSSDGLIYSDAKDYCSELKLIIKINNFDHPLVVYKLLDPETGIGAIYKDNSLYLEMRSELEALTAFLDVVILNNKKNDNKTKKIVKK